MRLLSSVVVALALSLTCEAAASSISAVGLGDDYLCRLEQGKVKCWSDRPVRELRIPQFGEVTRLSVGPEDSCVIADKKASCWSMEHPERLLPAPEIQNPIEVVAGKRFACVTTTDELVCWWTKEDKTLEVHRENIGSLKNPKLLLSWYDEVRDPYSTGWLLSPRYESRPCVVDDTAGFCLRVARFRENHFVYAPHWLSFDPATEKNHQYRYGANEFVKYGALSCDRHAGNVSCWRGDQPSPATMVRVPVLKNPKALATNAANACALDDEGTACWNENGEPVETPFPGIPLDLVSDHLRMCAVYPDKILCAGILSHGQENYWRSAKLTAMTVHPWQVCATDSKEARCWGTSTNRGNLFPPAVHNPVEMTSSGLFGAYACTRERTGLNCWGWRKDKHKLFVEFPSEFGSFVRTVGGTTYGYCAVFSKVGMRCLSWTGEGWSNDHYRDVDFPGANLQELTEIARTDTSCGLFGSKLICRKYSQGKNVEVKLEGISKVKHIAEGSSHRLYVLDQEGLKRFLMYYDPPKLDAVIKVPSDAVISSKQENGVCYSSQSTSQAACVPDIPRSVEAAFNHGEGNVPPLVSPLAIEVSGYFGKTSTCAIDKEGFKCWGRIFTQRTYQ